MRNILKAAAGGLIGFLVGVAPLPAAAAGPVKNIVLVHGAWADGSGWRGVYDILTKDGYNVSVVANPDTGLADDVAATQRVLDRQTGPVILVGHSYGGAVITEAGADPKVVGLVYIAAFAPDAGETIAKFLPPSPPPPVEPTKDGLLFFNRGAFLAAFGPDLPAPERAFMADAQVPLAASTFAAPITNPAWKRKPSWYLVSSNDMIIPPDVERMYAKRMKATTEEVAGSHVAFISHPQAAAHIIEEAAKGAGGAP
ncbi:MAG TPA: alpha/beta hydrolase [Caulobacteraceae bacterium]|nr:alpha/beta hydrolase [Caulobacteraceae bacterium]